MLKKKTTKKNAYSLIRRYLESEKKKSHQIKKQNKTKHLEHPNIVFWYLNAVTSFYSKTIKTEIHKYSHIVRV